MNKENFINPIEFLADAKTLIFMSSSAVKVQMTNAEIIHATTFYSLGVERLLKYILADINPVFILSDGAFKNAAPLLYPDKIIESDTDKLLADKPDSAVISFRIAMQRAALFSKGVKDNSQLLYSLAKYRDILAHRPLSELDFEKANRLLAKDGYRLINDICHEKNVSTEEFYGQYDSVLHDLGIRLQREDSFANEMIQLLLSHKELWLSRRRNNLIVDQARELTDLVLDQSGDEKPSHVPFECPACGQEAIAKVVPDYEHDEGNSGFISGVFIDYIKCFFCNLKLTEYEELNYVDADSVLK